MYAFIEKILYTAVLLNVLTTNVIAMDITAVWETKFRKAAESYGRSFEEFRADAEDFLRTQRETDPSLSYISGIEELIIVEKTSLKQLKEKLVGCQIDAAALQGFFNTQPTINKFLIPKRS